MDTLDKLFDREIDVFVNDVFLKTIKRHVRRPFQFRPTHGTVEVQKHEWVKVRAISASPFPKWRMDVERNPFVSANCTIKK